MPLTFLARPGSLDSVVMPICQTGPERLAYVLTPIDKWGSVPVAVGFHLASLAVNPGPLSVVDLQAVGTPRAATCFVATSLHGSPLNATRAVAAGASRAPAATVTAKTARIRVTRGTSRRLLLRTRACAA